MEKRRAKRWRREERREKRRERSKIETRDARTEAILQKKREKQFFLHLSVFLHSVTLESNTIYDCHGGTAIYFGPNNNKCTVRGNYVRSSGATNDFQAITMWGGPISAVNDNLINGKMRKGE
jgi:hypothetical protein